MDKFGTDAFRFTLAALAAQGRDIRLSEARIEGYRNFMNKIWNAARFSLPYLDSYKDRAGLSEFSDFTLPERWVMSRLNRTVQEVHSSIQSYRFNDAAQALYTFAWHEFCDWYIEESKIPLAGTDAYAANRSGAVLAHVLDSLLRMLHPFIPFITEEIAAKIPSNSGSIISGPFPQFDASSIDEKAEKDMALLMYLVTAVRNIRAEMNISPGKALPVVVFPDSGHGKDIIESNSEMIRSLARIEDLTVMTPDCSDEPPKMSAAAVMGEMRIFVPLSGIVDPDVEIARLEKELAKAEKEIVSVEQKLSNNNFLAKANPDAVSKQQDRLVQISAKLSGLGESLQKMRSLKGE